ncbi:hypothetical protein A3Q56_00717 [Intoshia linei]|uniref:Fibropellin-1 n=1 Tax=Intoshia linei TaxID=1819745 RepID=A0A177BD97_9BILA|nr:hypothetical protein A3Q56_00717 [Intoshia linei]
MKVNSIMHDCLQLYIIQEVDFHISIENGIIENKSKNKDNIEFECPKGWTLILHKCLKFTNHKTNWIRAENVCQSTQDLNKKYCPYIKIPFILVPPFSACHFFFSEGANLVKIWGELENEKIFNFATSTSIQTSEYWIGMNRLNLKNKNWMKWSNGPVIESLSDGFWAPNEPDTASNSVNDCVSVSKSDPDYIYQFAFKFNPCLNAKYYICEKISTCLKGYYLCNDGKCINNSFICDKTKDCSDGFDELNCDYNFSKVIENDKGVVIFDVTTESFTHFSWLITTMIGTRIILKIESFQSVKNVDVVQFWSAGKSILDAKLIAVYSGILSVDETTLVSLDNNIIIKFMKIEDSSKLNFKIQYTAVDDMELSKTEMLIATTNVKTLDTPLYPLYTYPSFNKVYVISSTLLITLKIVNLHLKDGAVLSIYDSNYEEKAGPILAEYRNIYSWKNEEYIISTTNIISIVIQNENNDMLFSIEYKTGCGYETISNEKQINSPGYGITNYPPNQNKCIWNIKPIEFPFGASLKLIKESKKFQVYSDDSLIIKSVNLNVETIVYKSTEDSGLTDLMFTSDSGHFLIEFTSNSIKQGIGFIFDYVIYCLDPKINENTIMIPKSRKRGDKPVFTCKVGHVFTQTKYKHLKSVEAECKVDGWSVCPIPNCDRIICGDPPKGTNTVFVSKTGITYESLAIYLCVAGTILDTTKSKELKSVCQENGSWTLAPTCKSVNCPIINVKNGIPKLIYGKATESNSIWKIECQSGFYAYSINIVQCGENTKWNPDLPTCLPISCNLRMYQYSSFIKTKLDMDIMKYKEKVDFACLPGFIEKSGKTTVECQSNQQLTDFECIDIDECITVKPCDLNSICINMIGGFKCACKDGYKKKDKNTCEDIDECLTQGGGCDEKCTNTMGSYTCSCTTISKVLYTSANLNGIPLGKNEDGTKPGDIPRINHSCINKLCSLPTLTLGTDRPFIIASPIKSKTHIYVGETVYFGCNIGYSLTGASSHKCSNEETIIAPTCTIQKCTIPKAPTKNIPILTPTFGETVNHGDIVSKDCTSIQNGLKTELPCIYNSIDNTYKLLYGTTLECPVDDCGTPPTIENANVAATSTYLDSTATITCKTNYHLSHDPSKTVTTIKCKFDTGGSHAYWNYESIQCIDPSCSDPPLVPQLTYSFANSKSYKITSILSVKCSTGYTASVAEIKCVYNSGKAEWSPAVVTCLDKVEPTFDNCPKVLSFTQLTSPNLVITARDNSGMVKITNNILYFDPTMERDKSVSIIYTATDPSQNTKTCAITASVKLISNVLFTCPASYVIKVESTGTVNAYDSKYTISNAVGYTLITDKATVSASDKGKLRQFKVSGTKEDQSGVCYYSYSIELDHCTKNGLNQIINAQVTYVGPTNGILTANLKCNAGYIFQSTNKEIASYQCNTADNIWLNGNINFIEDCVSNIDAIKEYTIKYKFSVLSDLTPVCITGHGNNIKALNAVDLIGFKNYCDTEYNVKTDCVISIITQKLEKVSSTEYAYITQFNFKTDLVYTFFVANFVKFSKITTSIVLDCPTLTYTSITNNIIEKCLDKQILLNGKCTKCPSGTVFNSNKCDSCSIGYHSSTGADTCSKCADGLTTVGPYTWTVSECISSCHIVNMIPKDPIKQYKDCVFCADSEKYDNIQKKCVACPVGQKVVEKIHNICISVCAKGYNSKTGYGACAKCPKNFYQDKIGQTVCIPCQLNQLTNQSGSINSIQCLDNNATGVCPSACVNDCTIINHISVCNTCPSGKLKPDCIKDDEVCIIKNCFNGGICSSNTQVNPAIAKCTCLKDYTGDNCETKAINYCANMPCKNGGVCHDIGSDFECFCLPTFSSKDCSVIDDYCTSKGIICQNGGKCVSFGVRSMCNCVKGYNGEFCINKIDYCAIKPCGPKGTCISDTNGFKCTCLDLYSGPYCTVLPDYCTGKCDLKTEMCLSHYPTNNGYCICPSNHLSAPLSLKMWNYEIYVNSGKCAIKTYCSTTPCQNGGVCNESMYTHDCSCVTGFKGKNCQVNIDDCVPNPCLNEKICFDGINAYNCDCGSDYSGKNCETYVGGCLTKKCDGIGTNISLPNEGCNDIEVQSLFQCTCKRGYYGNLCQTLYDNCMTKPCKNAGVCQNSLNSYSCVCQAGWSGKNCDESINICDNKNCQNKGICHSLFNDIFCSCTNDFYGSLCENKVSYCDSMWCIEKSDQCIKNTVKYTCQCSESTGTVCDYNDANCQQIICQNGLLVQTGSKYICQCVLDYEGDLCQTSKDDCKDITVQPPLLCIDGIHQYFTLCPPGFEGNDCKIVVSLLYLVTNSDFDLQFETNERHDGVKSQDYFVLDSSSLTVGFWFKLSKLKGVLLELYSIKSMYRNDDVYRTLQITSEKITLSINKNEKSFTTESNTFSVDTWYYLTVGWTNQNGGSLNICVGSTIMFKYPNFAGDARLFKYGFMVLGASYDTKLKNYVKNTKIIGSISQVNVWSVQLSHADIDNLSVGPIFKITSNLLLNWGRYAIISGVSVIRPSNANKKTITITCPKGFQGVDCKILIPDKIPPVFTFCPPNSYLTIDNRRIISNWKLPIVEGGSSTMTSNYPLGAYMNIGQYHIVYVSYDSAKNVATCQFHYNIQEQSCVKPSFSIFDKSGFQTCSDELYPFRQCKPKCPNNGIFVEPHPNLYTCGPLGSFNQQLSKSNFEYPKCQVIKIPSISAKIQIRYDKIAACNNLKHISKIKIHFCEKFNILSSQWGQQLGSKNGLCEDGDCCNEKSNFEYTMSCFTKSYLDSLLNVAVPKLKRKKRQIEQADSALIQLVLNRLTETVYQGAYNENIINLIKSYLVDDNVGDISKLIVNGIPTDIILKSTTLCLMGMASIGSYCVECPAGTFYKNKKCLSCPIGTFQDLTKQSDCKSCPTNTTTLRIGSEFETKCVEKCKIGTYHTLKLNFPTCEECEIGKYQDQSGQLLCKLCDADKTTQFTGSNSISDCFIVCPDGQEDTLNGCKDCPIGKYRTKGKEFNCVMCPPGYITTMTASKTSSQCTVAACEIGYYGDKTSNICKKCPIGEYQDIKWQNVCKKCSSQRSTINDASTEVKDCLFYCDSGQYQNDLNVESCIFCPIGTYKPDSTPKGKCTACPVPYITATTGTKLKLDCNILKCPIGSESKFNKCIPCDVGYYKSKDDVNSVCILCPDGYITQSTSSISKDDCNVLMCKKGYEKIENTCKMCAIAHYNPTDTSNAQCSPCPTNFLTLNTGSISIEDCSILQCPIGQQEVDRKCEPCPLGYYKNNDIPKSQCISCPSFYSTIFIGSKKETDCTVLVCQKGFEAFKEVCVPCKIGFYKEENSPRGCKPCPLRHTTKSTGTILIDDCNVHICSKGYEPINYECHPCKHGFYKIVDENIECTACPSTTITRNVGSTAILDCNVLVCPLGREVINRNCEICDIGFYSDTVKPYKNCKKCPKGYLTVIKGAKSANDCNVVVCPVGFENLNNVCKACQLGYFKMDTSPFTKCKQCMATFTTLHLGSKFEYECSEKLCFKGFEEISGNCVPCKIGFYKSDELSLKKCIKCKTTFVTKYTASTSNLDCTVQICEAGYESVNNKCQPCKVGEYKDNNNPGEICTICPATFVTVSVASTSITDCIIHKCPVGFEGYNSTCFPCKIGYYKDNENYLEGCTRCTSTFITLGTGSTSIKDCKLLVCDEGYEETNNMCSPCKIGYYKNNKIPSRTCQICPSSFLTPTTGSKKIGQCNVFMCEAGYQEINGLCVFCEMGYYKESNLPNTYCVKCPSFTTTNNIASISKDECNIKICPLGYQVENEKCVSCPIGTFKNNELPNSTCLPCPTNYTTQYTGTVQSKYCNIHLCLNGFEDVENVCVPCKIGFYKDETLSKCLECPDQLLTEKTGSTSLENCSIRNCFSGHEYMDAKCIPCKIGYYKYLSDTSNCIKCPNNKITEFIASTMIDDCTIELCNQGTYYDKKFDICKNCGIGYYRSITDDPLKCNKCKNGLTTSTTTASLELDCDIINCNKGFKRILSDCIECERGTYQPNIGQSSCIDCPKNYTTIKTGMTVKSDCIYYCESGYEQIVDALTCQPCKKGTYRNHTIHKECKNCPLNYTTLDLSSVSIKNCNIADCKAGQFITRDNVCEMCPIGTFSTNDTVHNEICISCPETFTTADVGSISKMDCFSNQCTNKNHNCGSFEDGNICVDTKTGFTCKCRAGWTKKISGCQHLCDTQYCKNSGICDKTVIESPKCICTSPYTGIYCDSIDVSIMSDQYKSYLRIIIIIASVVSAILFLAIVFVLNVIVYKQLFAFMLWYALHEKKENKKTQYAVAVLEKTPLSWRDTS